MRVVNRNTFLDLPAGTIYAKGKPMHFDTWEVKGETIRREDGSAVDWTSWDPAWPAAHDSGEAFATIEDSLANGSSFRSNGDYGRDGRFDEDDIFLIFEGADLVVLREAIDAALELDQSRASQG